MGPVERSDRPQGPAASIGAMTWTPLPELVRLMTMSHLPLADVKARLSEIVQRVNAQHERVTITVHGRPAAVLISVDDLESLEETIAVLSDPELMRQVTASEAERAAGLMETAEDLDAAMEARRARGE
jgi:antitoxin YefM